MKICDNGSCENIETWTPGKGLNNIKTRVKEINGTVKWYKINEDENNVEQGCCINVNFPI